MGALMTAAAILVIEDDPTQLGLIVQALEREGHAVTGAPSAVEARRLLGGRDFDLVILDLGLPDADGLDVLASLREELDTPVVVVTGRESVGDRVLGLDTGADDYLVKPVAIPELVARTRAVLRRTRPSLHRLDYGPLTIDLDAREVRVGGASVGLTRKEFDLLTLLAGNPRRVFTRADLLRDVWGSRPEYQVAATVTEHVRRLRNKIAPDPRRPRWIVAVHGVGYRFEPPGDPEDAAGC